MSPRLKELEQEALTLPVSERAALAERLISSLDETDEAENERLWVAEAAGRYEAYKQGKIPARSAEEALRDARARLK
jgi:putative addiction module component (TIGR02574 family)